MVGSRGTVEAVLRSVAFATERFLRDDRWHERMNDVLEELGRAAEVDRAYLFENVRDHEGRLWMDLRFEWVGEDARHIFEAPANHLHPYAPAFARWIEVMGRGELIAGPVEDLPDAEHVLLKGEDVVSVIAVPVSVAGEWWGFIGFDDCYEDRDWSAVEISGLRATAAALGAAIERERAERTAVDAASWFKQIVESIPALTYVEDVNDEASPLYMSPQIERILGYTAEEWTKDPESWPKSLHPDDRAHALAMNARHNETGEPFSLEYRLIAKDGHIVWMRDEAALVRDERGQPLYSHGVMMDITESKRAEEHVAFLAYHDDLTELPNRAMFEELLEMSIARVKRHDGSVAVVCVDLDDFRLVNDSLGHDCGDELLRQLAVRLREATRETDLVARRGGDQFLLLLADLERDGTGEMDAALIRAESVAQRVHEALGRPFEVGGTEVYVSASMGISLFPQDAPDATQLMHNAEAAMRESKKAGPNGYVVSNLGVRDAMSRLSFVTRLRKAVERQDWVLYYQPIVELATGHMNGVESLIRWREPDGTIIAPGDFIPLAEELGVIETIGDWVVEELGRQDEIWRGEGLELEIGFNLSPRQFWQPDLAERIRSRIEIGGLDPSRLIVEVTESSAMMDPERAQRILWDLHNQGLRIAIDDFGTGYSSLSRLREMPVEILKVDRAFVANVDTDPQSAAIVGAFIDLAHGLGMTSLAEGIERPEEWRFLTERGCTLGQGFYFSHPVPAAEIVERFKRGDLVLSR